MTLTSVKSLWKNFGPLFFTVLLYSIEVCGICLCAAVSRSYHSVSVEVSSLTGPLQHLAGFSHSLIDLPVLAHGVTFDSRILWCAGEVVVDSLTVALC